MKRLFFAVALLALAVAASDARADVIYAVASQTISNVTVSPAGTFGTASTSSQASAVINGVGVATNAPLDALEAYQGGSPPAPQNFFPRYAPGNPPVSPTTPPSFTRGDSVITGTSIPGAGFSVVAESYLNIPPGATDTATGSGLVMFSVPFTPASSSTLVISYNYANDLFAFTSGAESATAAYQFNITVKDSSGNVISTSSPGVQNMTALAPPNGSEVIQSGSVSFVGPQLTGGATYALIFSLSASSSLNATPAGPTATTAGVPEPSTLALVGLGGLGLAGWRRWRKGRASA